MSDWTKVPIGHVAKVVSGYAFKSSEFGSHGVPVLKIKNVRVGRLDVADVEYVSDGHLSLPERYHSRPGDILVSLTGSHLTQPNSVVGRVARHGNSVPGCLINQRVGKFIVKDASICHPPFLFYALSSFDTTRAIAMQAHGSASQANVSPKQVESVEMRLPNFKCQLGIATILGAYDELIEVNRRRVAILEQMARGLFEEWFVRFRFPGHEADKLLRFNPDNLPAGWSHVAVGEVAAYVNRGIAPKYADDVPTLVIGQKCIRDQRLSLSLARRQAKTVPADKLVRAGDVLINSTGVGTLGRVAQTEEVPPGLTVDSHVTIVRPAGPGDRDFLGLYLMRMQPLFEALGAGSTGQTELARTSVQNQEIVWPPAALRSHFGTLVRPMRILAAQLLEQNTMFATARDLLIPRLISGQISVKSVERELEEAA